MNAQKDFVESDERFESAWAHLVAGCAAANVQVPDPEAVRSYLHTHPDMVDVTGKFCWAMRQEFGADAPLRLRLYVDREIDDRLLDVTVYLPKHDPATSSRLDAVMEPFEDEFLGGSGEIYPTVSYSRVGDDCGIRLA